MKTKYSLTYLLIILIAASLSLQAQERQARPDKHPFQSTLTLGVEGGATWAVTDYDRIKPNFGGRVYLDYYFPSSSISVFGLRGFVSGGWAGGRYPEEPQAETFKTSIKSFGGGVVYSVAIKDVLFPYVFAGASYTTFDPTDTDENELPGNAAGAYDTEEINYHADAGLRFALGDAVAMNINLGAQFSPDDNWDDINNGSTNDMMFTSSLGFSYSFFSEKDTDGDGVMDDNDQCPDTPYGVAVDNFGCPKDSDNDGVPNYKDNCPNTPVNVSVDAEGCPLDDDNDGVPNYEDKCPNTQPNMAVNEQGCPDTDNDGVADNLDKCPKTPERAKVDDRGCPVDTDGDGVPDYLDECENTPKGVEVDEKGCDTTPEVVIMEKYKEITLSGDTNFEFNKAKLLPSAYEVLEPVLETMRKHTEARWTVEGHTDAVGNESYNEKLSRERAEAVVGYFTSRGIDRNRFEIKAMGETDPIASNDNPEGRAMNRRVEIKLIESGSVLDSNK